MKAQRAVLVAASIAAATVLPPAAEAASLDDFKQIVVIYQENHSFDNLYGLWGRSKARRLTGCRTPTRRTRRRSGRTTGRPIHACCRTTSISRRRRSPRPAPIHRGAFPKRLQKRAIQYRRIHQAGSDHVPGAGRRSRPTEWPTARGCRAAVRATSCTGSTTSSTRSTGATRTATSTGSDAAGLVMGHYDTTKLPIYRYLHRDGAPHYVIADRFFQAAFGGSFLNHQWLVAAATPVFAGAANDGGPNDLHAIVDVNGMPASTPLYTSPLGLSPNDPSTLSASCNPPAGRPATPAGIVCGDCAVNTIAAVLLALCARHARRASAAASVPSDDRRPAERRRRRLGLVFRRLVERERRHRRAGLDQRQRADLRRPERGSASGLSALPGQAVPVSPPGLELFRRTTRREHRPAGTICATRPSSSLRPRPAP